MICTVVNTNNNWFVCKTEGYEYLIDLLDFLLIEYVRIFGEDTLYAETCLVYNDPEAECPILIINAIPIQIRLAQSSLNYWAQTIFQLSHELCHYCIRQRKDNKNYTLSWFEEIVCEAISLYFLKWAADNWNKCKLSRISSDFGSNIKVYLSNELIKMGTDEFKICTDRDLLKKYEESKATDRETHRNERNKLFFEIVKNPEACKCFCDYPQYLNCDKLTIDFNKWVKMENNQVLRFLSSIQPVVD